MTTPALSRQIEGYGRVYVDPDNSDVTYPSVTTVIGALAVESLTAWKVYKCCRAAADHPDHLAKMVRQLGAHRAAKRLSEVPERLANTAGEAGDRVHNWAEATAKGESHPDLSPDEQGYAKAWWSFVGDFRPKWVGLEVTTFNRTVGYAGTADFIAVVEGRTVIGDYKTGPVRNKAALQLAALAHAEVMMQDDQLVPMIPVDGGLAVHLDRDGHYEVYRPELDPAWEAFRALVVALRWEHGADPLGPQVRPAVSAAEVLATIHSPTVIEVESAASMSGRRSA